MIAKLPTFYHSAIIKSQRDWQKSLEMLSSLVPKTSVANNSVYTAKGLVSEIQHKPGFSMSSKGLNESASGADQFLSQKDISKVSSVSASLLSNSLHARSSSSDALASPGAENLTMSQDNVDHHMTTYSNLRHNQTGKLLFTLLTVINCQVVIRHLLLVVGPFLNVLTVSSFLITGYQSPEEHALNCSTIYQDTSVPSKLVVLWTPFWHHWEYWDKVMRGATNLKQRRCPVWRCEFVWSKEDSVRRVEDADAIVFFSLDLFSRDLPNRHAHQLWIWLEFEVGMRVQHKRPLIMA
ncbi:hypothetical protein SK128_008075 [Halocaridina rubra]|uniref:Uncharacterized protein n=1 Tax=Halocaridina rubra TaxID=373956 RepID=A0AAN8ZW78_HALRR